MFDNIRAESARERNEPLRLVTCGGLEDGESALLARQLRSERNFTIAAAASADAAVLLVDARRGFSPTARSHSYLLSQLGLHQVLLVVTGMDAVEYSEQRFLEIEADYRAFAGRIGLSGVACVPVSARGGDNIAARSARMPWYRGPTLFGWLESAASDPTRLRALPFRLPVESVSGLAGTIASGTLRLGDRIRALPSGKESRVIGVATGSGNVPEAFAGQQVTLTLSDPIEPARGELLVAAQSPAQVADQFEATVAWAGEQPMLRSRTYLMRIGTQAAAATVAPLKYRVNFETLEHVAAEKLERNEIGVCELELDAPVAFDPCAENRATGAFVLIDRLTNDTVAAGMLHFALRRAHNVHLQHIDIDKAARAALKRQQPCVLWLTGLSGAGKSTVANLVERKLHALGRHTYLLDGDNVRHGLSKDLGFTAADRVENIRRIAEVAKLMVDAGLIVLTAFISPFRAERGMARGLFRPGEFIEVFVDAPLKLAEERDPKGLYKKARRGEIKNFTGIDSPYEKPEAAELRLDTGQLAPEAAAERVLGLLRQKGIIGGP